MEWLKEWGFLLTPTSFLLLALAWMFKDPISASIRSLGGRKEIAKQIAGLHTEMRGLDTRLEAHIMAEEKSDSDYLERFRSIGVSLDRHEQSIQSLRESNVEFRVAIAKNHEDVMRALAQLTAQVVAVVQRLDTHITSHHGHAA